MFKQIKWFIQRGRRGWADCDNWNANSYLSKIIIGMVTELKERHCGCPPDLYDSKAVNNECHKWEKILEEIKQGFEAYQEMEELSYAVGWVKKNGKYEKEYNGEKEKQLAKKFDRGMELFSKYFMNLWD